MNNKLGLLVIVILLLLPFTELIAQSQPDPFAGLDGATDSIKTNYIKIRNFLWALAGVVAAYGSIKVFAKYQNQDQDTTKAAGMYAFGFVFLLVTGFIINGSFINN